MVTFRKHLRALAIAALIAIGLAMTPTPVSAQFPQNNPNRQRCAVIVGAIAFFSEKRDTPGHRRIIARLVEDLATCAEPAGTAQLLDVSASLDPDEEGVDEVIDLLLEHLPICGEDETETGEVVVEPQP